jgi:TRAP-type C4-dicarboxylate transport system permease small subunit
MHYFLKFEDLTTGLAMRFAIGFLVIATALALFQVVTRFAFGHPSIWSEVITRSAMIWSIFMGVAPAFRQGSMISVEVVQRLLPPKLGLALYLLANVLSIIFFAVLFWQGWSMTLLVVGQKLAALEISIAYVYAALPVGSVFAILAIVGCMVRGVQGDWEQSIKDQEVTG